MKKVCLALLVLALTIPTMGAVNITLVQGPEPNSFIVGYTSDAEVRGIALDVTVTDAALLTATAIRVGGHDANFYITPTNVQFNTVNNTTRPWPYNSPIVDANASKCTIEMGTLYASNDPCNAHKFGPNGPPFAGDLVKLFVSKALRGADNQITITVTAANAKRGKVVLKGPPVTSVDPVLPAPLVLAFDCLQQGETCGGVVITAGMAANWLIAGPGGVGGKPASWCHTGHFAGDADQNCIINAVDLVGGTGKPFFKAAFGSGCGMGNYQPSCDTNNDCIINAVDLIGGDPLCPNCGPKANWGAFWPNPPCVPLP